MTTSPEIKIEIPGIPQPVEEVAEQFPETQIGAAEKIQITQITPVNPPQIQVPSGAQITSVPVPPAATGHSVVIPHDPQTLKVQAKGGASDTSTWNAWFWLRMVKKALAKQITVLVKGGDTINAPKS